MSVRYRLRCNGWSSRQLRRDQTLASLCCGRLNVGLGVKRVNDAYADSGMILDLILVGGDNGIIQTHSDVLYGVRVRVIAERLHEHDVDLTLARIV